ncbi:MAG: fibro-slime domain-containing protein, partial [Ruminococcus sp.]|nr:fibro-slime domain-containing protein [Ruminococcus sp.]
DAVRKANETYDDALQAMTASSGNKDIIIKAYQLRQNGDVADLGVVEAAKREYDTSYTIEAETSGPIVFAATPNLYATDSPEGVNFTVEYYAYIDDFDYYTYTKDKGINSGDINTKDGKKVLEAFDTSKRSDDNNEKTLPKNGKNNHRIAYYLEETSITPTFKHNTNYYKAKTNEKLHPIYLGQSYNVANYSRSGDVNILANSTSYYPTEIQVYDGDTPRGSYNIADKNKTFAQLVENMAFEEIKALSNGFRFTTDKTKDGEFVSGNSGPKYIYVTNNTKIKFIFDEIQQDTAKMSSTLYDYDITDGGVYTNTSGTVANKSTWYSGYSRYIYTNRKGINSVKNYDATGSSRTNFGFGTGNVASGLSGEIWNNYTINAYNRDGYNNRGCTFGLITGFDSNLNPIFADGISAPTLFGQSNVSGKTIYNDVDLNFDKSGDCYTLSSVSSDTYSKISADNLQYFAEPKNGGGTILTNNFFPLDNMVDNNDSHDVLFGDNTKGGRNIYGAGYSNVPPSDDFSDHNSYFGMAYQIKFTLADNYTGPLNYLFYGDDDMWVFLDDQLICDIGGIHSSVGEYVDLWEYLGGVPTGTRDTISTKSTTHTLTFFYTERGASGSCCYMRYTLPSVMSVSTEKSDNSTLKIEKVVEDTGAKIIEEKNSQKYTLNYGTNGNGNGIITAENKVDEEYVSVNTGSIVKKESTLRFTISPDDESEFTKLTKNGKTVSLKDNSDLVKNINGTYTYKTTATGDNNETNIVATFTSKNATKHTVTYGVDATNSKGANGTITATVDSTPVESEDNVIENKTIVFTVTPNATSEVKEIKVNNNTISLTDDKAVSKDENGVYTYTTTVTENIDFKVVFTKAEPEDVDPSQLLTKNIYLNVRNINNDTPEYYAWVWGYDDTGKFAPHFQKMELASNYTDEYLNNKNIYVLKLNYVKGQRVPSNFLFTRVNPEKADVIDTLIADPEQDVLEGWDDGNYDNEVIWSKTEDYTNFTDYNGIGSQPNYFETQFRDYTNQPQQLFMDWKYQGNISDKSVYFNEAKRYYFDISQIKEDGKRYFAYVWSDEHSNSG